MTREQTLRLAKAVQAICPITKDLTELATELLVDPKTSLAVSEPLAKICVANNELLNVVKLHYSQLPESEATKPQS